MNQDGNATKEDIVRTKEADEVLSRMNKAINHFISGKLPMEEYRFWKKALLPESKKGKWH